MCRQEKKSGKKKKSVNFFYDRLHRLQVKSNEIYLNEGLHPKNCPHVQRDLVCQISARVGIRDDVGEYEALQLSQCAIRGTRKGRIQKTKFRAMNAANCVVESWFWMPMDIQARIGTLSTRIFCSRKLSSRSCSSSSLSNWTHNFLCSRKDSQENQQNGDNKGTFSYAVLSNKDLQFLRIFNF